MCSNCLIVGFVLFINFILCNHGVAGAGSPNANFNYNTALQMSLLFYEAQRSGKLPPNQRVKWRGDSALADGEDVKVNLVGGYYDAGDHVKFGFPLAFTMTMLSWGVIEFRNEFDSAGELDHALEAIKWGMEYLIKAHLNPNVLYGQVGEARSDHKCWERAESMTTDRSVYSINEQNPGSDLAAETAAAFAASSIAFKNNDTYFQILITHAKQLFEFAQNYPGFYQNSITDANVFYGSSGYKDELLWAAAWLYIATGLEKYQNLLNSSDTGNSQTQFGWDNKFAGAQMLVTVNAMVHGLEGLPWTQKYKTDAEMFLCSLLQKGDKVVRRTEGGLLYFSEWSNLHAVGTAIFVASVYSKNANKVPFNCNTNVNATPSELDDLVKYQVDYMLGLNPENMSYMVGFGSKYPTQPHHRGSSNPSNFTCQRSFYWLNLNKPNPNIIFGAVVGGPNIVDQYEDIRSNFQQGEPALSTNAAFVGVLARLASLFPIEA